MVSQFLFNGTGRSVKAAAGRVVSLWAQLAGRIVARNTGNYCRAKAKIPVTAIGRITRSLAHEAELQMRHFDDLSISLEADQAEDKICPAVIASIRSQPLTGRIINVDGLTIDAPDTPDNQAVYPQNPVQPEGLGFPILRCVGLISMITGMLIDLASAPYTGNGSGETALLRQLQGSLRRGDILVADSYYCTYWLIALCLSLGVELVMKNHHKRDGHPLGAKRLNDSERTVNWLRPQRPDWMSKKEYKKIPATVEIRLVDIEVNRPGSRSVGFTLATTMLDNEQYPAAWLGSLYEGRWIVEPDIESIKCTMGLEHLRSQTLAGIQRELWTGLLTYNLIRAKMLQSSFTTNREIRSSSFSETYQVLSSNWLVGTPTQDLSSRC